MKTNNKKKGHHGNPGAGPHSSLLNHAQHPGSDEFIEQNVFLLLTSATWTSNASCFFGDRFYTQGNGCDDPSPKISAHPVTPPSLSTHCADAVELDEVREAYQHPLLSYLPILCPEAYCSL